MQSAVIQVLGIVSPAMLASEATTWSEDFAPSSSNPIWEVVLTNSALEMNIPGCDARGSSDTPMGWTKETEEPKGKCDHGGIVNISKPSVVQLNFWGVNYKWGGWGSDSLLGADQGMQFVSPLNGDARIMSTIRYYNTYDDLLIYKHKQEKSLPVYGQGGGMIMYNKSLYYNCYNTKNLCKLNIQTNAVEQKALADASYNNRFSYSSSAWQDIDLASDEDGLWVIYATEEDSGNIRIGKLNATNLELMQTWSTTQYKPGVTNTFMVCGVLYATRTLSTKKEEIFYMYDTNTSKEDFLTVRFDKIMENVQSLSYNPNDHKLYMFNDGYLITYDLTFKELK